ncbi:unnamed protein product, partial [Bubo scandiacus]
SSETAARVNSKVLNSDVLDGDSRFRTMGILHVSFQSFQKPVVKTTSKGSYKK